jgi:predicted RNase H-like nuclease
MPTFADIAVAAGRGRLGFVYRYGDLSMAVYGHRRAGQAIAQAARRSKVFPGATHFVPNDWRLSDGFVSSMGSGRSHWIERLRADGIPVDDDGLIPQSHRGGWRDLEAPSAGELGFTPEPAALDEGPTPDGGLSAATGVSVAELAGPVPDHHDAAAQMTFIGVDLAWGQKGGTGVCVVRGGNVLDSALLRTDEQILKWLAPHTAGPCLVAIDAPIVVINPTGRRPCESVLSRWLGGRDAGPHSSNTTNPAFASGTRGSRLAAELGLGIDPHVQPGVPVRRAIEVYPHPALVVLFGLPKTLKYKAKSGRTVEARQQEFRTLIGLLEMLAGAAPPLRVSNPRLQQLKNAIDAAVTHAALDRAEDELDAYVCAYTGLHHWTHGAPNSAIIGSLDVGYIVTPLAGWDATIDPEIETAFVAAQSPKG